MKHLSSISAFILDKHLSSISAFFFWIQYGQKWSHLSKTSDGTYCFFLYIHIYVFMCLSIAANLIITSNLRFFFAATERILHMGCRRLIPVDSYARVVFGRSRSARVNGTHSTRTSPNSCPHQIYQVSIHNLLCLETTSFKLVRLTCP